MSNQKLPQHKSLRKKDKNEADHLRGEIRNLEKQVKSLTQQLKYFEKRDHLNDLPEPEEIDEQETQKKKIRCEECARGFYDEFEILNKVYGTCNLDGCGHRKRLK